MKCKHCGTEENRKIYYGMRCKHCKEILIGKKELKEIEIQKIKEKERLIKEANEM